MPTKLPDILPSSDLLKQVDGIESGLRNRQRARGLGWVVIGAIQFAFVVYNAHTNSKLLADLQKLDAQALAQVGIILLPLFALGLVWLFISWNAFWLKASESPFRYTYWVDAFEPLSDKKDERLSHLQYDLAERLSKRIGRLSRAHGKSEPKQPKPKKASAQGKSKDKPAEDAPDVEGEAATSRGESHIHIRGYYAVRDTTEGSWQIEVTAWVAVGPPGSPESKAHLVRFPLRCKDTDRALPQSVEHPCKEHELLDAVEYDQLVERVYFSIATQIYTQIRDDVDRKIALLPTRYFKATAYLHEADDYARSNTFDAYEAASKLYQESMRNYRRSWQPLPGSRLRRWWHIALRGVTAVENWFRRWLAYVVPGVARVEVLGARAELGYTKMLLYRRSLAALSGRRVNAVFEAAPIACDAVKRLKALTRDVPDQDKCLFDAHVAAALALGSLGSYDGACKQLADARQLMPGQSELDPGYLFVCGCMEADLRTALLAFLRAVELDPQFEVAQFQLAATWDKLWRRAPTRTFEADVAAIVARQYQQVLKINPGNVAAWEALGYVEWLQGGGEDEEGQKHLCRAEYFYQRGREYKEIKSETFVADLDQGLARIAAERGVVSSAYQSYMESVTSYFAVGFSFVPRAASPRPTEFQFIGEPMIARFRRYLASAEKRLSDDSAAATNRPPTDRIRDCLRAFVWNDFAEACYAHYIRVGDPRSWEVARDYFQQASELNKKHENRYVMPDYNLHRMYLMAQRTTPRRMISLSLS